MGLIEHSDMVDITELATAAQEAVDIVTEPEEHEEDEVLDARELLDILYQFSNQFGVSVDREDPDTIVDALNTISRDEEYMIAEDHFTDYCKELVSDLGYLPDDLPSFIESNINWDGVASDLKADYSTVTLDGEDYLHRDS